jgi:transcriptional regulator with XRE-family HTH domain
MILKDYKRAERLNEVYKHLFANFGIKSKKEMADYMKIQRTGLSAALNGAAANLTDNLFKKICLAWPGVFNLDYLLTGEGRLLLEEPQFVKEDNLSPLIPSWADAFLDILANQVKENEALNRELRQSIERANVLCANLETLISKL